MCPFAVFRYGKNFTSSIIRHLSNKFTVFTGFLTYIQVVVHLGNTNIAVAPEIYVIYIALRNLTAVPCPF